ncbi:condensation domain-containing protein [Streptomyces polygonati]|uniref:Condensation domain-containing protein n=1 Tax=Streptomyces polygonati TaxID=1617087 RepID=A0ABV8HSI4_9ACTN
MSETEEEELALRISAERSGRGPATWGQQVIWDSISSLGDDGRRYNQMVGVQLDPPYPRSAVLDALTAAARRHEALRTRLEPSPTGELTQVLDDTGQIPVVIRRCAPAETERVGKELLASLAAGAFDCAAHWPIRVGLVEAGGLVRHFELALSHTAVDGGGLRRLTRDVVMLLAGTSPESLRKLYPATQPLDEAAYQKSDRGRRRDAAARRHWCARLGDGPRRLFPARAEHDPDTLFPNVVLHSPALLRSVDHVAAVRNVSGSSVLLAAVTRGIARLADAPEVQFQLVVGNRFLPGMAQTVTTLAQDGLFHAAVAEGDFPALLRRVHASALGAYRYASYDKRLLDRDVERLRKDVPELADHSCFYNDTREPDLFRPAPPPGTEHLPLPRAREQTTVTWPVEFPPRKDVTFGLDVLDTPGALDLTMTADTSRVPRPVMEEFLREIEATIIEDALATGCV